jgi:integrase
LISTAPDLLRAGPGAVSPAKARLQRFPVAASFKLKTDAQTFLNGLTADVQRGEYVDPRKASETFGTVAEQWILTKQGAKRKPKTLAGYRSLLDTIVLPQWGDVPLKRIDYERCSTWLGMLATEGSQTGKGLSASRITQAHQLVGAVLKYAQKTGKIVKNVALEFKRGQDIPQQHERERRYLSMPELLRLAEASGRFQTLTLVLGMTGIRFGEAAALRRKHVGDRELTIRASATHVTGQGIVESTTKSKRARHVRVPGPVWERLKTELPDDPNALVFPRARGGILPSCGVPQRVRQGLRRGGHRGFDATRPEAYHGIAGHQCWR